MRRTILILAFLPLALLSNAYEVNEQIEVDGIMYSITYNRSLNGNEQPGVAVVVANSERPYSGSITIPEKIEVLLKDGFINGGEDDYYTYTADFPVIAIAKSAFINCVDLSEITIPSSIKSISSGYISEIDYDNVFEYSSNNLFEGCSNLSRIVVNENNPVFDSRENCNAIIWKHGSTYFGVNFGSTLCASCKNTIIPSTVEIIGDYAFANTTSLTSINIPNSVKEIGSYAFKGCQGLKNIEIPSSVNYICEGAFSGCLGIEDVFCYNKPEIEGDVFYASKTNATLHVQDVDIEAFKTDEAWSFFKNIVVIEKVTDFNIIYYVDGVEYKNVQYKYDDKVSPEEYPIKEGYTFSGWTDIPSYMPGEDIRVDGHFIRNEVEDNGIVYWILDEKAVVLNNNNVNGDISIISSVNYNEKEYPVTEILNDAFIGNNNISSVVIPNSITFVGDNAFQHCRKIKTIEIGTGIKIIGERAFANIDKLTDVTVYTEDVPQTDRTTFENSYPDYVTLHVPYESIDKYKGTGPWSEFKSIVAIDGDTPDIPETPKCATPTITYANGQLSFSSTTEEVEYVYEITDSDIKKGYDALVNLTATYNITVYATKSGYDNSDVATATLCWIDVEPKTEGIIINELTQVRATPLLIQSNGNMLSITGAEEGTPINVYDTSGKIVGSAKASLQNTIISTNLRPGEIGLVKIGDQSVKILMK